MKKTPSKRGASGGKKPRANQRLERKATAKPREEPRKNPDGAPLRELLGDVARREAKSEALEPFRQHVEGTRLTTDQGIPVPHTDDSLKAGTRGAPLLEDFHLREKIMRFDHERIPERVVHARGSGAHGFFQVYESLERWTCADFLCDPAARTPVFVRFSTVVGSRGSADTVRDVRGFATKFYTRTGNFDLVGNNIPVFFIQDGIKFPDLVHAVKPEPHHEIPQGQSAHDTFWDFVSLVPETLHMVMWVMSDRGIPRSYRMMEGFGVHTFRLVNAGGRSVLCKFHWKPLLGAHSLVWDEAQKISGKDPDFHRRDLWEAIESGNYPEYELGLQIVEEEDEQAFGFDLLDPTKVLPEEVVPVRRVGRLTLDRNPDNFFAETEQVAFCVGNVVPGIDFSNDPLLHARLFSYLDTQLTRLGGPNFAEIPINRPLAPVQNHQQDGFGRRTIPTFRANYHPNSIEGNQPALAPPFPAGFEHFPQRVAGAKNRERAESFIDPYTQARLFLDSQSPVERAHLVNALRFELGKVERLAIRERVLGHLREVEEDLAAEVAAAIGVRAIPVLEVPAESRRREPGAAGTVASSPALSLENQPKTSIRTRKIAVLVAEGVRAADFEAVRDALFAGGAVAAVVGPVLGPLMSDEGRPIDANESLLTASSVLFDAVHVCGGSEAVGTLAQIPSAIEFVREAFAHAKTVSATNEGAELLEAAGILDGDDDAPPPGVLTMRGDDYGGFAEELVSAIRQHRHWDRGLEIGGLHLSRPSRPRGKAGRRTR